MPDRIDLILVQREKNWCKVPLNIYNLAYSLGVCCKALPSFNESDLVMMPLLLFDAAREQRLEIAKEAPQERRKTAGRHLLPEYADSLAELQHLHRYSFAIPFATGLNVVDIGCAEGNGCDLLCDVARSVIGVDTEAAVATARSRYKRPNLTFVVGHASALPVESGSADLLISFGTLEHLSDHELFWSEIRRVLKSTGIVIISSSNGTPHSVEEDSLTSSHSSELSQLSLLTQLTRHFRFYSLFSQSTFLGSSITPNPGTGEPRNLISEDQITSVPRLGTVDGAVHPFSIALASTVAFQVPRASLCTGDYPANAMALLTSGIAEREQKIRQLEAAMASLATRTSTFPVSEAAVARDAEIGLLRETLAEQARTIDSIRALLDECTRRLARAKNGKGSPALQLGEGSEKS